MRKSSSSVFFAIVFLMSLSLLADAQTGRKRVTSAEVTGTFKMNFLGKKFKDLSNRLDIMTIGDGKLRIAFDLLYPYTLHGGERSANLGNLSGEASIEGDTAIFESTEFGPCRVTIKFVRPGEVKVTQNGTDAECGFGHNVTTNGIYRKVNGRKPKFEALQ